MRTRLNYISKQNQSMTKNEITRRFPNASEAFIAANVSDGSAGETAKLEPDLGIRPLAAKEVQRFDSKLLLVVVTSIRKRLIDEDNLCEKYHIDLCRYAGIIPGDSPDKVRIETRQIKAGKNQAETVVIEVFDIFTV